MAGETGPDVGEHLVLRDAAGLLEDDAGHGLLAVFLVRHADDLYVLDGRVGVDEFLDLLGVDVLAAADDHVLQPPGDAVAAVFVPAGQIAGVQPALLVNGGGRGLGHLVVAFHGVVAARAELAVDAVRHFLAGLGVDDLALDVREGVADRRSSGSPQALMVLPGADSV